LSGFFFKPILRLRYAASLVLPYAAGGVRGKEGGHLLWMFVTRHLTGSLA
jgi:hypothetical protein